MKKKTKQSKTSGIERSIKVIAVLFTIALFSYACTSLPKILELRPSYYALIPLTGILSSLILLFIVNARRTKIGNILWFSLFILTILYWGVSELMLMLSANVDAAAFWRPLTGVASAFIGVFMLLFVIGLTRPKLLERKPLPWVLLFGASFTFLYLIFGTNLFINHSPSKVEAVVYGFEMPFTDTGGALYLVWLVSLLTLTIILLVKHYRHQVDPIQRKQGRIFLTATLIFFIGTIALDVMLPSAGITSVPPVGQILATVMAALYVYGLLRYNLFVVDPATAAPNILQTMAEAVIITDRSYRILFSNQQAQRLLGRPEQSATGAVLTAAFKPANWDTLRQAVENSIAGGKLAKVSDTEVVNDSHTATPVDISISQVTDDNGDPAGIVWVLNNISDLKEANIQLAKEKASVERKVVQRTHELAEVQARLSASLTSLPFGFAIVTPEKQIAFHNDALASLLGRSIPRELDASAKVLRGVAAEYATTIDILACIDETQSTNKVIQKDIAFGTMYFNLLFVPIIQNDNEYKRSAGTVMIMEDTTEKKAMDRSRDEFFSIASHELRTPLTAIRGNSDMILNYYGDALKDPGLKEMIDDMHDSSTRLITVVNDFLDSSRLEQGRIQFKSTQFDMAQLIRDTLREYDVTGSRKKLALTLTDPPTNLPAVYADRDRVRQILINLIGNSIKFTEKGGVTIALTPTKGALKIAVTDTGKGIPVESQHLLFHKFQQATDSILTRDNTRGTGLGLYISRLLAEGMNGKLRMVSSEVNKGSTFELQLPCKPGAKAA